MLKKQIQKEESIRIDLQRLLFANESLLNNRSLSSYSINNNTVLHLVMKSTQSTNVVAGGYGQGNKTNKLNFPYGLFVDDDDQTLIIADWENHRIVQWKIGEDQGKTTVGDFGQGNQLNQLSSPTDVILDKQTNCLFICDRGNRRVLKWSRQNQTNQGEIFIGNITCRRIAIDNERLIYISDTDKHQVRKYKIGETNGTIIHLKQFMLLIIRNIDL